MSDWEAPAKLNFDLRVAPPDRNGMHPLRSLIQTIEWFDLLTIEVGDEDALHIRGADLPDDRENLVWKAADGLGVDNRPPLDVVLEKRIPEAAGLGGGSSDAAAILQAVGRDLLGLPEARVQQVAASVGADVAYFLSGGTAWMEGYGEKVTRLAQVSDFAVAVAVPEFDLATPEVYRRWDELEGPTGPVVEGRDLPPSLRRFGDLRNDLTPAAIDLRPELADWISDLAGRWERPVLMSGSGPSCFAFFLDLGEAGEAAATVAGTRATMAAELRPRGVAPRET
jgi:4-diphosphocytidyl-2-C-methyl-D-erythritol kinase